MTETRKDSEDKEDKKELGPVASNGRKDAPSLGNLLGLFFVMITAGGILLSFGAISLIRWFQGRPATLPMGLAILCIFLGLIIDLLAVVRFWRWRNEAFEQMK